MAWMAFKHGKRCVASKYGELVRRQVTARPCSSWRNYRFRKPPNILPASSFILLRSSESVQLSRRPVNLIRNVIVVSVTELWIDYIY